MNCVVFEDCRIKTKRVIAKYMHHLTNTDFGRSPNSNPCSFPRCNHSTDNINKIEPINTKNEFFVRHQGKLKRLPSTIPQTYPHACPRFCARKTIQPNIAKKNVSNIWQASFHDGMSLPLAT